MGWPVFTSAAHLVHVRHRMNRQPSRGSRRQRLAARGVGARVIAAFLVAERSHAEHRMIAVVTLGERAQRLDRPIAQSLCRPR
jgi:hypothetical protein